MKDKTTLLLLASLIASVSLTALLFFAALIASVFLPADATAQASMTAADMKATVAYMETLPMRPASADDSLLIWGDEHHMTGHGLH